MLLLKNFAQKCQERIFESTTKFTSINRFLQDESRFGLFTHNCKALTAKGIKPICPCHKVFKTLYLLGAFTSVNGDKFLLEIPKSKAAHFQVFRNDFLV